MAENTLRQADNEVVVEGILQEVRLDIRESANKEEYISGEIDIEKEEGSVHTFRIFSKAKKKDGSDNGIFKGLKTVKDEYLSVAKVVKDEADKVRITSGQLGVNDYVVEMVNLKHSLNYQLTLSIECKPMMNLSLKQNLKLNCLYSQ